MAEPTTTVAEPPPEHPTTPCTACQAPVVWAIDHNSNRICVDPEPATPPAGQPAVLLTDRGPGTTPLAEVVRNPARLFGRPRVYRRHVDTCPHKAYFQNRARKRHP